MRLVAEWRSRGGKYQLKLFACQESVQHTQPYYRYETLNSGGGNLGCRTLDSAIDHVEKHVLAHWPSKPKKTP